MILRMRILKSNTKNNLQLLISQYIYKKKTMGYLTNEEKATLYNDMLSRYERISEQIRQIKAKNFEVSLDDQKQINLLEGQMRKLYLDTQRLYK
jgi:hypothetical protein